MPRGFAVLAVQDGTAALALLAEQRARQNPKALASETVETCG